MKKAFQKSRIPEHNAYIIKELVAPSFDKNWHFHPEYQLFLVLEGHGTRFVGDDMRPFQPNDMVLTGPNLPHLWRNDQAYFEKDSVLMTRGIVVYFPEDFLGEKMLEKEEFEEFRTLLKRAALGLQIIGKTNRILKDKLIRLVQKKGMDRIIGLLEILLLISRSTEVKTIVQAGYINANKESEKDRMSKVHAFVMDHFQQDIKQEKVAELINMTSTSFSRYFKSRMNKSFSDFLSEVRISHACKLLHTENLNISEISYESGFNTLSNFNRQFKNKMGVTPKVYKRDFQPRFDQ
ncbi:AraC family transcriptional regulator [Cyclobacterium marinum]|uniref:AraC family transcriptional regulator n=1 Tax=Cyclobacterium marinum TaxID=104 RepID=UPI0030DC3A14|tara:strand:+ start:160295 stop:161173 length:879 start_codon:yes stop_codon:yes gene_type:complete